QIVISKILLLFLFLLFCFFGVAATLQEATEAFQRGELKPGIEICKSIIGESEELNDDLCKAYIQTGIAYFLEDSEEMQGNISSLHSLLEGYLAEAQDKSKIEGALAILAYLSEKLDENSLSGKIEKLENDWKATAVIAKFLVNVKKGADAKVLVKLTEEYFSLLSGYKTDCWATAWYPRLKLWSKWILNGEGDKSSLEKLIAQNGLESRKEREKAKNDEKYAILSSIIESYLKNDIKGAKNQAEEAIKKFSAEENEKIKPVLAILSLLAQKENPSFQDVFNMTKNDPQLWSLGALAFFVRYVSDKNKTEQNVLLQCLDNYKNNSETGEVHPQVAKWKERVLVWEKWCESGFTKGKYDIEPLLVAYSKGARPVASASETSSIKTPLTGASGTNADTPSLDDIKTEDFILLREQYQKRPRPAGLLFKDEEIKKYLLTLPEQTRKIEKKRYEQISKIREYLIRILERNPYPKGLKTKNGTVNGQVAMANESIVIVRSGKKNKRFEWSELAFEQFENFLLYYAQQRLNTGGGGLVSKEESKKNSAQDFLLLAILCDWYGKYDSALKYGRKAVSLDESIEAEVSEFLFK
ncbi:MAG: hypothetical protein QXH80_03630, partial [Candidatus Nanoarchaeia archaeon]